MKALLATFLLLHLRSTICEEDVIAMLDDEPPRDVHYFEDALKSPYFVDKTRFLKEAIDYSKRYKLIMAPKNFGKSTLLDMIRRFYQMPIDPVKLLPAPFKTSYYYKLFRNVSRNLEIMRRKQTFDTYFGKFNVLYISYANIRGTTELEIRQDMQRRIKHAVMAHSWLCRDIVRRFANQNHYPGFKDDANKLLRVMQGLGNEAQSVMALKALMRFLKLYFKNDILVLIEDYDAPVQRALRLGINAEDIHSIMQRLINTFVRHTLYARYVLITGEMRPFHEPKGDPLIMLRHYCFTYDLDHVHYFGFKEEEVERLLTLKNIDDKQKITLKQNHNGYRVQNSLMPIYNIAGVRKFLEDGILDYEIPPDYVPKIMLCLRHKKFFNQFGSIIWNRKVTRKIDNFMDIKDLHHFNHIIQTNCSNYHPLIPYAEPLFDNGYLTFTGAADTYQVPNRIYELKLRQEFRNFYENIYQINVTNSNVATAMYSIANAEITTDQMLVTLKTSLNQLFEPLSDRQLSEFDYHSILFSAVFSNLRANRDAIYVRDINDKYELPFSADKLVLTSNDQTTILIAKVSFEGNFESVIANSRNLVPAVSVNDTTITLVKYLGININANGTVSVGRANRRRNW